MIEAYDNALSPITAAEYEDEMRQCGELEQELQRQFAVEIGQTTARALLQSITEQGVSLPANVRTIGGMMAELHAPQKFLALDKAKASALGALELLQEEFTKTTEPLRARKTLAQKRRALSIQVELNQEKKIAISRREFGSLFRSVHGRRKNGMSHAPGIDILFQTHAIQVLENNEDSDSVIIRESALRFLMEDILLIITPKVRAEILGFRICQMLFFDYTPRNLVADRTTAIECSENEFAQLFSIFPDISHEELYTLAMSDEVPCIGITTPRGMARLPCLNDVNHEWTAICHPKRQWNRDHWLYTIDPELQECVV